MMFFVTPALDPAAPEYEKQKYRRELLEERTTKVFHAFFTYLFSITRGAPDADVDKYFVKQEGLYTRSARSARRRRRSSRVCLRCAESTSLTRALGCSSASPTSSG